MMGTEIFGFRKKLCPWRPFKEGTPHLVQNFTTTFSNVLRAKNDHLVIGYQMGKAIFEYQPNLYLSLSPWVPSGATFCAQVRPGSGKLRKSQSLDSCRPEQTLSKLDS